MQMHQLDLRIRKMLSILEELSVMQSVPVQGIEYARRGSDDWVDFISGGYWGAPDEEWFNFRFKIVVPQDFRGQTVLSLRTGRDTEWEPVSPQIEVYVDGRLEQAFDARHREMVLCDDQEVHHFTYSILPHEGDWREANTPEKAYMLNIPVLTGCGAGEKTSLPAFVQLDKENVMVEVVKQQLDGEDTILRLYECFGKRTAVTMTLGWEPESVKLVNMLEDELEDVAFDGRKVRFTVKPYEIVTFKVR